MMKRRMKFMVALVAVTIVLIILTHVFVPQKTEVRFSDLSDDEKSQICISGVLGIEFPGRFDPDQMKYIHTLSPQEKSQAEETIRNIIKNSNEVIFKNSPDSPKYQARCLDIINTPFLDKLSDSFSFAHSVVTIGPHTKIMTPPWFSFTFYPSGASSLKLEVDLIYNDFMFW